KLEAGILAPILPSCEGERELSPSPRARRSRAHPAHGSEAPVSFHRAAPGRQSPHPSSQCRRIRSRSNFLRAVLEDGFADRADDLERARVRELLYRYRRYDTGCFHGLTSQAVTIHYDTVKSVGQDINVSLARWQPLNANTLCFTHLGRRSQ